jgi:hypothetical protein
VSSLARAAGAIAGLPRDRYVLGQRLYFEACDPRSRATLVLPW